MDDVTAEWLSMVSSEGGFAYPSSTQVPEGGTLESRGMTMRDWFAGQALINHSTYDTAGWVPDEIAAKCFAIADAMLKARSA